MHTFHAWAVDEDFEHRHRTRNIRNRPRGELKAEVTLRLAVGLGLVEVGALGGFDQVHIATQDAVFVEHGNVIQRIENRLFQLLLLVSHVLLAHLARQIKTRFEQAHQLLGDVHVVDQSIGDVGQIKAQADLLQVAGVGTQQRHFAPRHTGHEYQAVKRIVLRLAGADVDKGILINAVQGLNIHLHALRLGEGEIVNPELFAIGAAQAIGEFTHHAQA